jgi:hypothetical protein
MINLNGIGFNVFEEVFAVAGAAKKSPLSLCNKKLLVSFCEDNVQPFTYAERI